MKCHSCNKEVNNDMKHSITINVCPFCGKSIIHPQEVEFRKGLYKILLKNSVDDESQSQNIINQIMDYINGLDTSEEKVSKEEIVQESIEDKKQKKVEELLEREGMTIEKTEDSEVSPEMTEEDLKWMEENNVILSGNGSDKVEELKKKANSVAAKKATSKNKASFQRVGA
jgi:hypothetical protein